MSRVVYVLNGPNLNLLGKRQPHIYGHETLADVERDCHALAAELGLDLHFHQSNREYEIIDWIHEAREIAGGIAINPAAFTHTSVAILDALNTFDAPVIEVHISNVHKREEFRHHSFVSGRADGVIAGFGTQGYLLALRRIAKLIEEKTSEDDAVGRPLQAGRHRRDNPPVQERLARRLRLTLAYPRRAAMALA
jgi:3-dehydroquinate dehydratase II